MEFPYPDNQTLRSLHPCTLPPAHGGNWRHCQLRR
jgi:hypothetical protein